LEDLCLTLTHRNSGSQYLFFPQITRKEYNIYTNYDGKDWFPFNHILLPPRYDVEKYILFVPQDNQFKAQEGEFILELQTKWHDRDWVKSPPNINFELKEHECKSWNEPAHRAFQIHSKTLKSNRHNLTSR
jgi:hypothetical protein